MSKLVTVILDDYNTSSKIYFVLAQEEFDIIEEYWDQNDQLLDDLQGFELFNGVKSWSDLDVKHWKVLVVNNLEKYTTELSFDEQQDPDNVTVSSLNFLMMGMIKKLQDVTDSDINLMKIYILQDGTIGFDCNLSMVAVNMPSSNEAQKQNNETSHSSKDRSHLSIIVNNDENDDKEE